MKRCKTWPSSPARRILLALPLLGLAVLAQAQTNVRPFPPNALRGTMVVTYPPIIQMDGKADRLSPGSRIRGTNNLLVLSGTLVGQSLVVNYVRNTSGEVQDVWILTDAEAALKLPSQQ